MCRQCGFLQFGCLCQWPQAVLQMFFWRYDCLLVWPESMQILKRQSWKCLQCLATGKVSNNSKGRGTNSSPCRGHAYCNIPACMRTAMDAHIRACRFTKLRRELSSSLVSTGARCLAARICFFETDWATRNVFAWPYAVCGIRDYALDCSTRLKASKASLATSDGSCLCGQRN